MSIFIHFNDLQVCKGRSSGLLLRFVPIFGRYTLNQTLKMLRTILVRNKVLNDAVKKAVRYNITRCLSTEIARRKQPNKLLSHSQHKILAEPKWGIQIRSYSSLPSHLKVKLPALSPTMETGSLVSWEKKEGDKLNEGDLLCEIETDKATMGFETPEEGFLAKILMPAGTKGVAVGKLICIIVENQADVAAFKDFKDDSADEASAAAPPAAAPRPAAPPAPSSAPPAAPAPAQHGRIYASPMAKRLAEIKNIRLGGEGSGLYGSIKSGDLKEAAAPPPPAHVPAPGASYTDIPLTNVREVIAKKLTHSKQSIPHYQLSVVVNVEKTLAMRKKINERLVAEKSDVKLSINDFILKAVASACKRVPTVNSLWMDTFIRQYSNVDISIAVATPSGLITPIVFNADSIGVIDISKDIKRLAAKAREGRLTPQEFQGGTVTVSNLGMFGISAFTSIINPPQSFILSCGGLQDIAVPDKDEPHGFRFAKYVNFTASLDHRVIDGAVGAQWMKEFKDNMEDPANMIL